MEELAKVKSQVQARKQARKQGLAMEMQSYPSTLNGQFIKEGEGFPCYEFPEPLVKNGKRYPGFEIFQDCHIQDDTTSPASKEIIPPCFD